MKKILLLSVAIALLSAPAMAQCAADNFAEAEGSLYDGVAQTPEGAVHELIDGDGIGDWGDGWPDKVEIETYSVFGMDSDDGGIPDNYEIAMFSVVRCLDSAAEVVYQANWQLVYDNNPNFPNGPDRPSIQPTVATLGSISTAHGDFWDSGNMWGQMNGTTPYTVSTVEVCAPGSDFDGDTISNLDEYLALLASEGAGFDPMLYAVAATTPGVPPVATVSIQQSGANPYPGPSTASWTVTFSKAVTDTVVAGMFTPVLVNTTAGAVSVTTVSAGLEYDVDVAGVAETTPSASIGLLFTNTADAVTTVSNGSPVVGGATGLAYSNVLPAPAANNWVLVFMGLMLAFAASVVIRKRAMNH